MVWYDMTWYDVIYDIYDIWYNVIYDIYDKPYIIYDMM